MKTQLTSLLSWASLLAPTLVCAQDSAYQRVVEISYARTNAKSDFGFNDATLFQNFDLVTKGITAVIPFFLNVKDPMSKYSSTIANLQKRNITIVPAIGTASQPKLNVQFFKDIAQDYREFTDHIRLELLSQYTQTPQDIQDLQDLVQFLTGTLNFKHIMLNPWPKEPGSKNYVKFNNPAVDATILSVLLDFDRQAPFTVHPNPTNWFPAAPQRIQQLRQQVGSNTNVLVNYENEPQMEALAGISIPAQKQAMLTTINQIDMRNDDLHWTAPFSQDYNPIKIGTWDFIAQQLNMM